MKKTFFYLIILIILISCKTNQVSQSVDYKDKEPIMYGMVYDNDNKPVDNAKVYINDVLVTNTDVQGRFILSFSKNDENANLKVEKIGYEVAQLNFTFDTFKVLYIKLSNAQQLLNIAEESLNKLNYIETEEYLLRALALSPDRTDIEYLLCIVYYKQNKISKANEILQNIKKKEQNNLYIQKLDDIINK